MMRSTGIVRKVDELGRVVLPIELRRTLCNTVRDDLVTQTGREFCPDCASSTS